MNKISRVLFFVFLMAFCGHITETLDNHDHNSDRASLYTEINEITESELKIGLHEVDCKADFYTLLIPFHINNSPVSSFETQAFSYKVVVNLLIISNSKFIRGPPSSLNS